MKLFGLAAIASTALVVSKLAGWTAISWWVVFSPVLLVGAIGLSMLCVLAMAAIAVNTLRK